MKYVLDACVAIKWFLAEPDSSKAIRVLDDFNRQIHELLAPDVFPIEVVHALSRAERRGLIQPPAGSQHLSDLLVFLPAVHVLDALAEGLRDLLAGPHRRVRLSASTWRWRNGKDVRS